MLTYSSDAQKIRMWHKHFDHPSLGYLKHLFPSISFKNFSLDCESCVLAKSHKHTYTYSSSHSAKSHNLPPQVFSCVVYVHLKKWDRNKLQPRAVKCVFVGYGVHKKGYRCFDPVHDKMYTTMDCDFLKIPFIIPN